MKRICSDLKAEHEALEAVLVDLDDEKWMTMTSSPGWAIKDQICHLAYADGRVSLSINDPEAFMIFHFLEHSYNQSIHFLGSKPD